VNYERRAPHCIQQSFAHSVGRKLQSDWREKTASGFGSLKALAPRRDYLGRVDSPRSNKVVSANSPNGDGLLTIVESLISSIDFFLFLSDFTTGGYK
jgi:hypothetical protein